MSPLCGHFLAQNGDSEDTSLYGHRPSAGHLLIQESPKGVERVTGKHPRDRIEPGPLWAPRNLGAVATRGLAKGQAPCGSAVQGRGFGL